MVWVEVHSFHQTEKQQGTLQQTPTLQLFYH
jgi:hypothetical protein